MEQNSIELVWLDETNGLAFQPYILQAQFMNLLETGHWGIGVLFQGRAAGALVGTLENGVFQIDSLMVSEKARGCGAGRQLIAAAKAFVKRTKGTGIVVEFPSPTLRELEIFLQKQGFSAPVMGNRILKIPLNALPESPFFSQKMPQLKGKIMPMHKLPQEVQAIYKHQVGQTIPRFVSVEAAGPSVLQDATLGYVENGQVRALIVSSELEDGSLYLNSVYAAKGFARALYPLFYALFSVYLTKYKDREMLYVSAVNEEGMGVISHMVGENWDKLEQQIMQRMTWQSETERSKTMAQAQYPAIDILIPKLMALKNELEERGQSSDLIVSEGNFPILYLPFQTKLGEEIVIELRYIPLDVERLERFVLAVLARVSCEELPLAIRQLTCTTFNLETLGPMACVDPVEDFIYLRTCLPEAELPTLPPTFFMMVDMFCAGIDQLQENIKNA